MSPSVGSAAGYGVCNAVPSEMYIHMLLLLLLLLMMMIIIYDSDGDSV